jgi:hypothetical protein
VTVVARAAAPAGRVQPVALAVTNGGPEPARLDTRQIYALDGQGARFAPIPPAEAARQAGGTRLPGAVKGGVVGAAAGSVLGALGGAISGAIQGGIGAAVAVGSAVGATVGAVTGVLGGGRTRAADVAGFTDRALPSTTLAVGLSATGYVYYPSGTYSAVELLLMRDGSAPPVAVRAAIEPPP